MSLPAPYARYSAWHGGPDPLQPPFDVREALDQIGDDVLAGDSADEALRRLLKRGTGGVPGLDELRRRVAERARETRRRGQLDGTLRQVRELLDQATTAERETLAARDSDAARLAESELDALPRDTARAVRELADYAWQNPEAQAAYDQIRDLLRRDVLDAQFHGMKQALAGASAQDMNRIKDMLADLNEMLAADARGEHTPAQFDEFMAKYGEFFHDAPADLAELVDSLARRAAAQQRLLASLSAEQRAELGGLLNDALGDLGLASELDRLAQQLQAARPDLRWGGRERMRGDGSMGLGDATSALAELADLDELAAALDQDYAGASLADVDPELVQRALGQGAAVDLETLRRIERELSERGLLVREHGKLSLSPRAVRRIGETALRRVFDKLSASRPGAHDVADAGAAGEPTGGSREWRFGDEQPLDVVRTLGNAVRHTKPVPGSRRVRLAVEDFEVIETERRTTAAVILLVDLSYSMELRGAWGEAKSTALALHSLITTRYPQDSIQIIGFSNYARVLSPADLADLSWDMVQGTNLQHALLLAGRELGRHPGAEPVVLVVTDGEPTAHLDAAGVPHFAWPPLPDTLALTFAEVDRMTRRGATINVFMLAEDPGLVQFVQEMAQRNGGRVFSPGSRRLGEYVVRDYLRARRGRRGAR